MQTTDLQIVNEFKKAIPPEVSGEISRIYIFGSRVTGQAREDSDLDVAVLIKDMDSCVEQKLEDIAYNVMMSHDFKPIISLKVFSESRFNEAVSKNYSFYKNILSQGVAV